MRNVWIYRGIPEGKRVWVWTGDPNGKSVKAPEEEGYYDLVALTDENNNHAGFKWEKSKYTKPEMSYEFISWYPIPDSYWG